MEMQNLQTYTYKTHFYAKTQNFRISHIKGRIVVHFFLRDDEKCK